MAAKITASAPILLVKDIIHSANWYKEKLGFSYERFFGEPANFCMLHRNGFYLMLSKCNEDKIIPHWKVVDKMWDVYFWVDDVESIYNEI